MSLEHDVIVACIEGDLFRLKELLLDVGEFDYDSEEKDSKQELYHITPLISAVVHNQILTIKYLIEECGCNINYCESKGGYTALMLAALNGNVILCEYLCSRGANAKLANDAGITAATINTSAAADIQQAMERGLANIDPQYAQADEDDDETGEAEAEDDAEATNEDNNDAADDVDDSSNNDSSSSPAPSAPSASKSSSSTSPTISSSSLAPSASKSKLDPAAASSSASSLSLDQQYSSIKEKIQENNLKLEAERNKLTGHVHSSSSSIDKIASPSSLSSTSLTDPTSPAHNFSSSDHNAFQLLPLAQATQMFIARYKQACSDSGEKPLANVIKAVTDAPAERNRLLLRGTDIGIGGRINDRSLFPFLDVAGYGFPNAPFQSIDLSFNKINNAGAKALATYFTQTSMLTELDLSGNDIERVGGEKLAAALATGAPKTLVSLNLNTNPIGGAAMQKICDMLADNRTLTHVDIGNTDLDTLCCMKLAHVIAKNQTLTSLNIDSPLLTSVQGETTIHIARKLSPNNTFTFHISLTRQLSNFLFSSLILVFLFVFFFLCVGALGNNRTLTSISMSRHRIRDDGCMWLSEWLSQNNSLLHFNLKNNEIGTTGVAYLVKGIINRPIDTNIILDNNRLKGQTYEEVVQAIQEGGNNNVTFHSRISEVTILTNNTPQSTHTQTYGRLNY